MKWPLHRKIGIGILIIGLSPLLLVEYLQHAHNWSPVDVPVRLEPGDFQSPQFKTDLNGTYLLALAVDRLSGPDRYRTLCLMGFPFSSKGCNDIAQTVEFDWQVVSNTGEILGAGSYNPFGLHDGKLDFGEFEGRRNRYQKVVLIFKGDGGELKSEHPRLQVDVAPKYWENLPDLYQLSLILATIAGALGSLVILVPVCYSALKKKSAGGAEVGR